MENSINQLDLENAIHLQPTINIGMIGSVSHGKTKITEQLTGICTLKDSKEQQKNITIKLGYANAKIFKCRVCPAPQGYQSFQSHILEANCKFCGQALELKRHISILDCPGHNLLMATMLNGTCVMDDTILVETIHNKDTMASQSVEHLIAAKLTNLKNSIVCINKLDLIPKNNVMQKIDQLKSELKGTVAESSPILPFVANHGINNDVLCEYICTKIKEPVRDFDSNGKMIIIRSFNVNHKNALLETLSGGVIGGTIMRGKFKIGDRIEILPGIITRNANIKDENDTYYIYEPLISRIESINSEKNNLNFAFPGGLIGLKLTIDPAFAAKDRLVGNIVRVISGNRYQKDNYKIFEIIFVYLELLDKFNGSFRKKDRLIINHNACNISGEIIRIKNNKAEINLIEKPICIELNSYVTISKNENGNLFILGRAIVADGKEAKQKLNIIHNYIEKDKLN